MTRMAAHSSRIRPRCHCMQIDRSRAHISLYRRHVTFNSKASSPPGGTQNGFNWIEAIIRQHRPLAVCKWHNRVERAGLNIRLHLHTPVKRIRPPRGIIARYFFFSNHLIAQTGRTSSSRSKQNEKFRNFCTDRSLDSTPRTLIGRFWTKSARNLKIIKFIIKL